MNDSNPFAKLQRLFDKNTPSRGNDNAKGSSPLPCGGGGKGTAHPTPTQQQGTYQGRRQGRGKKPNASPDTSHGKRPGSIPHKNQGAHDEDSTLFLRAVNALPKTPQGQRGSQEDSLFKQAMQTAGIVPMEQKKQKKRAKKTPPEEHGQQDGTKGECATRQNAFSGGQAGTVSRTTSGQEKNATTTRQDTQTRLSRGDSRGQTGSYPKENFTAISENSAQNAPRNAADNSLPSQSQDFSPQDDLDAREAELFASAMSNVTPVNKRGRDIHSPAESKKPPRPSGKTPAEIMQEIIDGRIEFAIQHTGEYMEGFVQGVAPEVLDKLRLGQYSPEAHIDLHGLNALQAYTELTRFIKNSYQRNIRTVTVITGRGKNSPEGVAVLRTLIQDWLTHDPFKRVVLAFCSAQPRDGGAGALYILLRKYKKSIGKIQWELPYSGPDADF